MSSYLFLTVFTEFSKLICASLPWRTRTEIGLCSRSPEWLTQICGRLFTFPNSCTQWLYPFIWPTTYDWINPCQGHIPTGKSTRIEHKNSGSRFKLNRQSSIFFSPYLSVTFPLSIRLQYLPNSLCFIEWINCKGVDSFYSQEHSRLHEPWDSQTHPCIHASITLTIYICPDKLIIILFMKR